MNGIVIVGASGHGSVIADILEISGTPPAGFIDDDPAKQGRDFFGYPVLGGQEELLAHRPEKGVIVAVGNNETRKKICRELFLAGVTFAVALHPSARIGKNVLIGTGSVVMAQAVINPGTVIGSHCIINTAASVDHDSIIGDYVHVSPGVHTGGTVVVGEGSWIGVGASIVNNITIGRFSVVGAGTVVIDSVPDNVVVAGNPARILKNR